MPKDLHLVTRGLPTPRGPTCTDRLFHWFFVNDSLTVPKSQCGQTDFVANDHAQAAWLAEHGVVWLREVWSCAWEWISPTSREAFMAIMAPHDQCHAEVARAMRALGTADAAGRAEAARALLAIAEPNLTIEVPALEQARRHDDPQVRAIAAAVLYRWHRRIEPAALASLFRDDDPIVRVAALQQAREDFQRDASTRDPVPFVLEGLADGDRAVRRQAVQTLEAAANLGLVAPRRVMQLRAELGPLVGPDGADRTHAIAELADRRSPRVSSAPAMQAFYVELCEVELLAAQLGQADDDEVRSQLAHATDRAAALWERLPAEAPDDVRLYDTRIDVLAGPELAIALEESGLAAPIRASRSPTRAFDPTAIYWVLQRTAPRELPAEYVRRAALEARAAAAAASERAPATSATAPEGPTAPDASDAGDAWQRFLD